MTGKDLASLVDRLLLEQGRLDPLELLLAAGMLSYEDYEAWRVGGIPELQAVLEASPADAAELLERAAVYAHAQRLSAIPLEHVAWGGRYEALRVGAHAGLTRGCSEAFAPPVDRPQLDLFHDSSVLVLEEEICQALAERRTDAARGAVAQLMRQDPRHRHLSGFLRLIQAIDETNALAPKTRLRDLEAVEPEARELLGYRARDFLAPLWGDLAESLAGQGFNPRYPRLHASFAWARAGSWVAVRRAVEAEPDWRGQSLLLVAHAEACWRSRQWGAARPDWMQLCWEHPLEAERALVSREFPDRRLAELWNDFGDSDLQLETEDFPAWLLIEDPDAAAVPQESAPSDDRGAAYGLVRRICSGEDDVALRRELAEIHPALLSLYLSRH